MPDIKLKIQIGNANVELEGEGAVIQTIFSQLCESGLGALDSQSGKSSISTVPAANPSPPPKITGAADAQVKETFPSIEVILSKNLPRTESEWILIYAFYASKFGMVPVSRDEIRGVYRQTGRLTRSRSNNFSSNLQNLHASGYLSSSDNLTYALTPAGSNKIQEILTQPQTAKSPSPKKRSKRNPPTYRLVSLPLDNKQKEDLNLFYHSMHLTSRVDQVVVLFYWMHKNKLLDAIDKDTAFTLLRIVKEPITFNISQALSNASTRNRYIRSNGEKGRYLLDEKWEDYVTHKLMDRK